MDDELIKTFEELRLSAIEWQKWSIQALGFNQTIEYNQVLFHVSDSSVVADLAPLAYLDLVQEIENGRVQTAVASLYERLRPLLECKHRWFPLPASARSEVIRLDSSLVARQLYPCVCGVYRLLPQVFPNPTSSVWEGVVASHGWRRHEESKKIAL